jgi:hypothetical protein
MMEHMRNRRKPFTLLAALTAAPAMFAMSAMTGTSSARADEATPAVRTALVSATQALFDALGDGKAEVWERTLAADAVIIDEFGRRQTKAEAVASMRPLPKGFSGRIEVRNPHVRTYGDTAVLDCELYEDEHVFDQRLQVRYIVTNTFVRRDGAWKLVAMHDVTLPTEPPSLSVTGIRLEEYAGDYQYGPGRSFLVAVRDGKLGYTTKPGAAATSLSPLGRDVFMSGGDERNVIIFRRDEAGRVVELIERRKFNDLHMKRIR